MQHFVLPRLRRVYCALLYIANFCQCAFCRLHRCCLLVSVFLFFLEIARLAVSPGRYVYPAADISLFADLAHVPGNPGLLLDLLL